MRDKLKPESIKEYAERLFIYSQRDGYDASIERCTKIIKSWKFSLSQLIFGLKKGMVRYKPTQEKKRYSYVQ
jgi:hypothetical protein